MTIETSDLNDGTILSNTKQVTQNGNVQFVYTLPSGKKVNSEWIAPEYQKKALMNWLETIRPMIANDAAEMSAAKRKNASSPPPGVPATSSPPAPETSSPTTAPGPRPTAAAVDPAQFAKEAAHLAGLDVEALTQQSEHIAGELSDAKRRHKQWTLIYNALSGAEK